MKFTRLYFIVLLCSLFFLSGGFLVAYHYVVGGAVTVREARWIVTAPFFAGFLLMGTFGLLNMYWHSRNSGKVFLGMVYTVGSYLGIEVLFLACSGGEMIG